jgi:predicted Zn-ribbon and HTH transcriptional regulator
MNSTNRWLVMAKAISSNLAWKCKNCGFEQTQYDHARITLYWWMRSDIPLRKEPTCPQCKSTDLIDNRQWLITKHDGVITFAPI